MAEDTKERILDAALEQFAQNGYPGTSMRDIADQLGMTKGALYKHYTSKQEILDSIVLRMQEMDYARAAAYEMPEAEPDGSAEVYQRTSAEYMAAVFRKLTDTDDDAMQLALEFYGPMFLLYSVYDGAQDKESVAPMLRTHIDRFIAVHCP